MVVKTVSRTVALLLAASPAAFGLGLGDIHLLSSLNAPLDAEIELIGATPEDLSGLKTEVASRDTFTRYGLDYPAFLSGISVQTVHGTDGKDVLKLRSSEAVTEPFVNLLLEVNWARGKLIREYTVLLDPPVYTPGKQAGAPVAAPLSGDTARAGDISRPPSTPAPADVTRTPSSSSSPSPSRAMAGSRSAAAAGSTRIVRRGDTLSAIAGELTSGDTRSSRKWMVAIYRGNPRAFDGNMNILRSGAELQIPDDAATEAISSGEANAEIRQQYAAWHGSTASAAEASDTPGHLKLVPPTAAPAATPGTGSAASSGDNGSLQNHVRELQAQLEESRKVIELRNAEVAQLQARLSAKSHGQTGAPEPETASIPAPASTPPETATPPATSEAPATEQPPTAEPAPSAPAPAAAPTPVEGQPSLIDKLKQYWWVLAALLVAILAMLGLRSWRARKQDEFDDSLGRLATSDRDFQGNDTTPVRTIGPEPGFLVEETGTHERPRFAAAASAPPNVSTDDTISSDTAINLDQGDPLAEADFHMAYGLYDQAADLVRIAISRDPERRDLKLKLLEVFFVWGNKEQFLQSARELASTRDQAVPGEWEKIIIMGKQLAPEDELFGSSANFGAAAAGGVDLDLEGGESRVDFDLLGEPMSSVDNDGVDLDIGSALGDRDATAESPTRTTDAHLALHDGDDATTARTREITREMPASDEPAPVMPDYNLEDPEEAATVEQPVVPGSDNPTIRQKVDMALKQGSRAEQTAELAIDDLGLDLTALDTIDQPGLGSSDAPTLVAGLDDHSRRVMAEASAQDDDHAATGPSGTDSWRVRPEDLDPTMPPTRVEALEGDVSATSRMTAIREQDIDFDFNAEDDNVSAKSVEFDVGTATVPDMAHQATQRISTEDLALPDLEPVTMSEVGTKLDLARAYMDMGDPEGARNILEEVLLEGSQTQKQEAKRLIESLPG